MGVEDPIRDVRELYGDMREVIDAAMDARQAQMFTALPVEITEDFDPKKMTVKCKPTIKGMARESDGKITKEDMPILEDVPVHFPNGGGATLTFPIKKGDTALAIFSSRSIDSWHQSGGQQNPVSRRMHDLSDAMVFVGVRPQPKVPKDISKDSTQLRVDDDEGAAKHFVDFHKDNGVTTSVDKGKHVTSVHPEKGISHSSTVAVNVKAPKGSFEVSSLTVKGGIRVAKDDQGKGGWVKAVAGLEAPIVNGSPGLVPDDES
jgi:hypothetical protein